ncbi:MAG: hypothetical protein ACD_79C01288G0002 [uncultured bacterium]|nr:MAG: hypothetical protein ACD_79C01288G0002 [uncultured bacterium]
MNYNFEWDLSKAKLNLKKHGIAFERSSTVFLDPKAISIFDDEHSEFEELWITLGIDKNGTLLIVCHTFNQIDQNNAIIRIISSRKANRKEIFQYREA